MTEDELFDQIDSVSPNSVQSAQKEDQHMNGKTGSQQQKVVIGRELSEKLRALAA